VAESKIQTIESSVEAIELQQPSCYLRVTFTLEPNQAPQTFGEMLLYFAQQQEQFNARMNEQFAAQAERMETLTSKPPAARKAEPQVPWKSQ
jgi:hypothetical protein